MDEDVRIKAESALGYTFGDESLLELALTHASMADSRLNSNERMEFFGDSILGMVIAERIYEKFPDLLEGEMTKIRSTIVSRRTCARIARELGLHELLALGKGMQSHYELPMSLSAAVYESVIAALYLDGGMEPARRFIIEHLDDLIDQAAASGHQQNFKSVLQQYTQQRSDAPPNYMVLDEKGPDHAKCFKVCVELDGRRFEPCWGQSKKEAEQHAALNALDELGVTEQAPDGAIRVVNNDATA
jgi:ribonuclease-3